MTDRYSFMNFFNVTLSVVLVTGLAIGGCTEPKPNRNVIGSVEEARLLPPGTTNVGIHASRLNNVKAMLEALQQSGIKSLDFNSSFVDAEVFKLVRGIDSLESVSITAASGFDAECVEQLLQMDQLKRLYLMEVDLTDESTVKLAEQGPTDVLGLGYIADDRVRPTSAFLDRLVLPRVNCDTLSLDVSWVSGDTAITTRSRVDSINEAAGTRFIEVGLVP